MLIAESPDGNYSRRKNAGLMPGRGATRRSGRTGISICDTTRDGSRIAGYTEVIQDGHRADQYPGSRPVFRNSDRASTPGYRDPGAFFGTNPASKIKSETYQRFARYTAKCGVIRPERGPYCDTVGEIDLGEDLIDLAHQPGGIKCNQNGFFRPHL